MRFATQWFAFEASHFYWLDTLSEAENRQRFGRTTRHHGHNYRVRITYRSSDSSSPADWQALEQRVRERINRELDHRCLNREHPHFQQNLPTTENLALYLWGILRTEMGAPVESVEVHESETLASAYHGEERPDSTRVVYLTRQYQFSSAHRLYNPALSEEQNRALYGKCANPYGHGHDYRLEVSVRGVPDPLTGMVINITDLDAIVQREVITVLDHHYLNEEVPPFDTVVPTTENLVAWIVERLQPQVPAPAELYRVCLWETPRSSFEWRLD
ncbi:MAG: 6-carboxytetrahydropterin synthase [Fimbriimonadales bacterium]